MTSFMNVLVRVQADKAMAKLAQLRGGVAAIDSGMGKVNKREMIGDRHIGKLSKFGNQLQWTGRMLQYNFTLPIVLAGAAATKFALDQEKAFVHVAKVYGDTHAAAAQFRKEMNLGKQAAADMADSIKTDELEALDRSFTALSNHYGVQKKEINEIAGAWAAAGASGRQLAESTRATLDAMIIGDMKAVDATRALISIQAQYNLNTQELNATLATFNSIENATGASMSDLITGMEKAAGVARSAGIETRQLAAYMAALVPATGTAATAGNALKTILSRLVAPTKESAQVMNLMGLEVDKFAWQSMTGTERIQAMAEKFETLSKAEKNAAASTIASRWQVNRFDVLMREVINTSGFYAKALDSSANAGENFTRMQDELNTVLESNPRKLQRMMVIIQNAAVEVIQPLIPHIIYLAATLAKAAQGFANMSPEVQKLVLFLLLALAAVGPVVRYFGALYTLTGVLGKGFQYVGLAIVKMLAPIKLIIGAFGLLGKASIAALGWISVGLQAVLVGFSRVAFGVIAGVANAILIMSGATVASVGPIFLNFFGTLMTLSNTAVFAVVSRFITGLVAMSAASSGATVAILGKFAIMWGAMLTAASVHLWAIAGRIIAWGALTNGLFAVIWTRIATTSLAIWNGMALMWAGLSLSYTVIWYRVHQGLMAISAAFGRAWVALQAAFSAAWLTVQTLMLRAWTAMTAAGYGVMQALSTKFWSWMIATWIAGGARVKLIWASMITFMGGTSMKALLASVARYAAMVFTVLTGPWGIAIAVVVGLLWAFRKQIAQIWNNITGDIGGVGDVFANLGDAIMGVFRSLPEGVQGAMLAVVTVVREAALAVYEWFSYINPFARHSPSLVENVTGGMAEVNRQFSTLSNIKKYTTAAYAEIKKFGALTAKLGISAAAAAQAEDRATLKGAGAGQALGSYNKLVGILNKLTPILKKLEGQMASQQRVVDNWQVKVDEANRKLDVQQAVLDQLQGTLDGYQNKLSEAEDALSKFANSPIEGMREMEEQIFANQMAQVRLRDEMMRFEDVYGTFDQLKAKIEAINGAQEILRGTQSELRAAGAGSEILGHYDQELAKLDQQKDSYADAADKLADMQAALDALARQAERLDLTKALKFDEMLHQMEMAANRMQELPFENIMAGIAGANAEIDKYGPKVDAATAAVAAQQAVVDSLTASRDQLSVRLEKEQAQLDRLKEKYDSVNDAIQAINSSLQDVMSSADKVSGVGGGGGGSKGGKGGADYLSPGAQNFINAGGANFPDPGGKGIPGRDDWSSQAGDIDQFTKDLAKSTSDQFGALNPFEPLKKKAGQAWDWIKNKASEVAGSVGNFFSGAFDGVSFGGGGGELLEKMKSIGEGLTEVIRDIAKVFKWAWDLLGPEVMKIGKGIWDGLKGIWEEVGPELAKFGELMAPLGEALQNIWTIAKPILALIVGGILLLAKILLSALGETIGPVFKTIGKIFAGLLRVVRGVFKILIGLFTLDFAMIFDGLVDIVAGTFKAIWNVIKGAVQLIWNPIKGLVKGIAGFFTWLWDVLVGHSIVPDIIEGIVFWFHKLVSLARWVWGAVLKPIWDHFVNAFNFIVGAAIAWWEGLKVAWSALMTAGQWFWDNVLKPIYDFVAYLWTDWIQPAFANWWAGVKVSWEAFKKAGEWLWENVLKPVWTQVQDLWNRVRNGFANWWAGIKIAWNTLKTAGTWIWENVLRPVWTKASDLWVKVKTELGGWWAGIKEVWKDLKNLDTWVKEKVMDPVVKVFKDAWNSIKNWLTENKEVLTKPMKSIVNTIISAVNAIINGLNKVSDILPGVKWEIKAIPELAQGGPVPKRRVGGGFKTNGARAIVGEGKANWPEFVIPTDPTYRNRARGLLSMAAAKIGGVHGNERKMKNSGQMMNGVPAYGIGGWIDDRYDDVKNVGSKIADQIKDLGKHAIGKIMDPVLNGAQSLVNTAGWTPARVPPTFAIEQLRAWVKDSDKNLNDYVDKFTPQGGGDVAVGQTANGRGRTSWKGGTFSNQFVAVMKRAEQLAGQRINVMQGGFRPTTSYSGTSHRGDAVDLQASSGLIRALRRVGVAAGDRTGLGNWGPHAHAVPGPGAGFAAGSAIWQFQDYMARGGQNQPLNSAWGLANGAIVKARRGGVSARIGEGLNDEAIVPLPRDYRSSLLNKGTDSGKREYNFYGNLEFPNITSPDDAKTFLENLDALAKD